MDEKRRSYITKRKAGNVVEIPNYYAVITLPEFQYAMGLCNAGRAHMQPIKANHKIQFEDGVLKVGGLPASLNDAKKFFSENLPLDLDLTLIRIIYSILLGSYESSLKGGISLNPMVKIYLPDFFRMVGKSKISRSETESLIKNLICFHSIMGVVDGDILPLLLYGGEISKENTICVLSPYMLRVMELIQDASVRRDKKGIPLTKKDGTYLTRPAYSRLILPSIYSERNKRAVEIVHIVTILIEQAGNHLPHIAAKTIIDRNPLLKQSMLLDKASPSDKNKTLKRAFKKAWELLRSKTKLQEAYDDIRLPDPNDRETTPTISKLDMVFTFPHKGKKAVAR